MESKCVCQSAGSEVSFCRMTYCSDRDKREVSLRSISNSATFAVLLISLVEMFCNSFPCQRLTL